MDSMKAVIILKIAICDDTQSDLENLKNCLVEYFNEKQIQFSIDGFNDCNVLLNRIKFLDSNEYDLFILDVIMQKNGVDIAKEIRKFNDKSIIIFETSSEEFAINAFKVQAFDYLLKPISIDKIRECFDKLLELRNETSKKHVFTIKSVDHAQETVDIKKITYIESSERRMIIHLANNTEIVTTSLRSKFLDSIPFDYEKYDFVNCHSSFLVNLNYVKAIKNDSSFILKTGQAIPISKRLNQTVRNKYANYLVGDNNG
jgi:DNA-binding LytR/AlgR family response regulator